LRNGIVSDVSKLPFSRRVERWLVGLVMAATAYMLEKTVLRSIRRGKGETKRPE
jgi:hypothetical protein